jgi:predicted DsbA family dithiol-disulfide isomerase
VEIEVFVDMICPFCYIGKRNLDRALAEFAHRDEVTVVHRSFQLDPDAARIAGETLPEREMRFHGLPRAAVDARLALVTAMAERAGLHYRLDRALPVHTLDAHRFVHFAAAHGRADDVVERLLRAYATEGRSIADRDTLLDIAAAAGLDPGRARTVLESDEFAAHVHRDLRRAAALGVAGVPTAVVDGGRELPVMASPAAVLDDLRTSWDRARRRAV